MSASSRYDIPGDRVTELLKGEEQTLLSVPTVRMSELYGFMTGNPYPAVKKAATAEFMRRLDLVDNLLGIETASHLQQ